jgi:hypothetical protein
VGFTQRRTEELGRRVVEQEAVGQQLHISNERLQAKVDGLLTANQQLELALATAWSSVKAQVQVVASMLERSSATAPSPHASAKEPIEWAEKSAKRNEKNQLRQGHKPVSAVSYMNPCRPSRQDQVLAEWCYRVAS